MKEEGVTKLVGVRTINQCIVKKFNKEKLLVWSSFCITPPFVREVPVLNETFVSVHLGRSIKNVTSEW